MNQPVAEHTSTHLGIMMPGDRHLFIGAVFVCIPEYLLMATAWKIAWRFIIRVQVTIFANPSRFYAKHHFIKPPVPLINKNVYESLGVCRNRHVLNVTVGPSVNQYVPVLLQSNLNLGSQNVAPRPAGSAAFGSLLGVKILRPYPRPTNAEAEAPLLTPHDAKNWLIGKDPDAGKDWRPEEKGMAENEMVGWHHRLNGHEFEQTPGNSEGRRTLAYFSTWGHKESDIT